MTLFLTGDRSMPPLLALGAVVTALDARVAEGGVLPPVATGDCKTGIEAAVRYLFPDCDVFAARLDADGKPDFDDRHTRAAGYCEEALVVHGDPLASTIYKSAVTHWADDALSVFP